MQTQITGARTIVWLVMLLGLAAPGEADAVTQTPLPVSGAARSTEPALQDRDVLPRSRVLTADRLVLRGPEGASLSFEPAAILRGLMSSADLAQDATPPARIDYRRQNIPGINDRGIWLQAMAVFDRPGPFGRGAPQWFIPATDLKPIVPGGADPFEPAGGLASDKEPRQPFAFLRTDNPAGHFGALPFTDYGPQNRRGTRASPADGDPPYPIPVIDPPKPRPLPGRRTTAALLIVLAAATGWVALRRRLHRPRVTWQPDMAGAATGPNSRVFGGARAGALGLAAAAGLAMAAGPARAEIIVTLGAPKAEFANITGPGGACSIIAGAVCTYGTETFAGWKGGGFVSSFVSGQNNLNATDNPGVSILGTYAGSIAYDTNNTYGGTYGTQPYPSANGIASYSIALQTNGVPGVNYFGVWITAMDASNLLTLSSNGQTVFSFASSDLKTAIAKTANPQFYYGHPDTGSDPSEPFAYVNIFDTNGFFDKVVFSNSGSSNFESSNHTVGYFSTQNVNGVPVTITTDQFQVDEAPTITLLLFGLALTAIGAVARRDVPQV